MPSLRVTKQEAIRLTGVSGETISEFQDIGILTIPKTKRRDGSEGTPRYDFVSMVVIATAEALRVAGIDLTKLNYEKWHEMVDAMRLCFKTSNQDSSLSNRIGNPFLFIRVDDGPRLCLGVAVFAVLVEVAISGCIIHKGAVANFGKRTPAECGEPQKPRRSISRGRNIPPRPHGYFYTGHSHASIGVE